MPVVLFDVLIITNQCCFTHYTYPNLSIYTQYYIFVLSLSKSLNSISHKNVLISIPIVQEATFSKDLRHSIAKIAIFLQQKNDEIEDSSNWHISRTRPNLESTNISSSRGKQEPSNAIGRDLRVILPVAQCSEHMNQYLSGRYACIYNLCPMAKGKWIDTI